MNIAKAACSMMHYEVLIMFNVDCEISYLNFYYTLSIVHSVWRFERTLKPYVSVF